MEYKIISELKRQNKTFPNQLRKSIQNPTTRWIFENFHKIQIEELKKKVIANLLEGNILGELYWQYYRVDEKIKMGCAITDSSLTCFIKTLIKANNKYLNSVNEFCM